MSRKKDSSTKLGLIAILFLLLLLLAQNGHLKWSVVKAFEPPITPETPLPATPSYSSQENEHDHSWKGINNKVVLTNLRDRVGIGLNNPSNKLHVLKKLLGRSTLTNLQIKVENPNRGIRDRLSGIAFVNRDSANKQILSGIYSRKISANEARLELAAGRKSKFDFNKPADMVIKSNGNVGIGTLFPRNKLDVSGTVKANKLIVDELCIGGECFTTAPKQLHLYDNNGQDLGTLIDAEAYGYYSGNPFVQAYRTYLPSLGLVAMIETHQDRSIEPRAIFLGSGGSIFFTNLNCQGNAYMRDRDTGTPELTITKMDWYKRTNNPVTRYYKIKKNKVSSVTALSYLSDGGCNSTRNEGESSGEWALEEITLPFTEPLAWPLNIR